MLRVPVSLASQITQHALSEDPNECCGILAGVDATVQKVYPITNTVRSPYRYLMDPQEQLNAMKEIELKGWKELAFYHSHTHGQAYPSATDVRMALESGWLDVHYVLVSLRDRENPAIRAFQINEKGEVVEDSLEIAR